MYSNGKWCILSRVPYQLQKVSKVAHVVSSSGSDSRGEFKAKCLAFKDKTAEGCAFLYPAEIIPEMVLSLMMWVRSDDIKGQGTVVSYAAHCRKAFILRYFAF